MKRNAIDMQVKDKGWMVCVAVVVVLLPMLLFRDFTPNNELRYLSIADEALAKTGDDTTPVLVDSSIRHAADMDVYLGDRMRLTPPAQLWRRGGQKQCAIITKEHKYGTIVAYYSKDYTNFALQQHCHADEIQ